MRLTQQNILQLTKQRSTYISLLHFSYIFSQYINDLYAKQNPYFILPTKFYSYNNKHSATIPFINSYINNLSLILVRIQSIVDGEIDGEIDDQIDGHIYESERGDSSK